MPANLVPTTDAAVPQPPESASYAAAMVNLVVFGIVALDDSGAGGVIPPGLADGTLLVGSLLVQLQDRYGNPLMLDGSPRSFRLWPADVSAMTDNQDPGSLSVRAFNTQTGSMDDIAATIVLNADGSLTVNLGQTATDPDAPTPDPPPDTQLP